MLLKRRSVLYRQCAREVLLNQQSLDRLHRLEEMWIGEIAFLDSLAFLIRTGQFEGRFVRIVEERHHRIILTVRDRIVFMGVALAALKC